MNDNIIGINGNPINISNPFMNEDIQQALEHFTKLNNDGKLKAIAFVGIDESDNVVTWDLTPPNMHISQLLGAIEIIKYNLLRECEGQYTDIDACD